MEKVKSIVKSIQEDNANKIQEYISSALLEKVVVAISDKKAEVAKNLFAKTR